MQTMNSSRGEGGARRRAGGGRGEGPAAFSMIELLCVTAVIGILAALLLPVLTQARQGAVRVKCIGQLHDAGQAFQAFAHDHGSQFPMQVPVRAGGTLELARSGLQLQGEFYLCYRHFQALSNDLVTPKPLACPADTRVPAGGFGAFNNENLSYFIGVDAEYARPNSLLAGDRNITNDLAAPSTLLRLAPDVYLRWTADLHHYRGNFLFADGRVEKQDRSRLSLAGGQSPSTALLVLPSMATFGSAGTVAASAGSAGGGAASPAMFSLPAASSAGMGGGSLVAVGVESARSQGSVIVAGGASARSSASAGATGPGVAPAKAATSNAVPSTNAQVARSKPPAATGGVSNGPVAGPGQASAALPDPAAESGLWKVYLLLWLLLAVIVTLLLLRYHGSSQRRR